MAAIDTEVLEILRGQDGVAEQSHQGLAAATEEIFELHRTMRSILEQASMTQEKVDAICKDIRAMDNAKRNLTRSITILENFGTLTDALAVLKETGSDRCAGMPWQSRITCGKWLAIHGPALSCQTSDLCAPHLCANSATFADAFSRKRVIRTVLGRSVSTGAPTSRSNHSPSPALLRLRHRSDHRTACNKEHTTKLPAG
jgi:hypothetical protein